MTGIVLRVTTSAAVRRLAEAGCVYPELEASILAEAAGTAEDLDSMVSRREAGEPLEYIVGWTDFLGIRFMVDEGVFIPRPRSGLLVQEAASLIRCMTGIGRSVVVVDLCCGVGAVGGALAAGLPQVDLYAADVDPHAVACARANLAAWGASVYEGDLFAALPRRLRGRIDVLVASPPYVPTEQIGLLAREAREFESLTALDGGVDGLDVARRIARGAGRWLPTQGCLALEIGPSQIDQAEEMLDDRGYAVRVVTSEEYGSAVVVARDPR